VYTVYCVMYQVCTVHCARHISAALNMESTKCEMASAHACAHSLPIHLSLHQQAGSLHQSCCKLTWIIFMTMLRGGPSDRTSQQASQPQPSEAHHPCALSMRTVLSESLTRLQPMLSFDAWVTLWPSASDSGVGLIKGVTPWRFASDTGVGLTRGVT